MIYSFKDVALESLGFIPGREVSSVLALTGHLSLPSRLGKTHHVWGNEIGIEPYVLASEIFLGGRDMDLMGYVTGRDFNECETKASLIKEHLNSATELAPLLSDWGTNNVFINGEIKIEPLCDTVFKLRIPFHEPAPDLTGSIPESSNALNGIDGISFEDLGGFCMALSYDRLNRPAPKRVELSAYGKEAYQINKVKTNEPILKLFIQQPTLEKLKEKISGLYALFTAPGLRKVTAPGDGVRTVFIKDGFTVDVQSVSPGFFTAIVECKLTEAALFVAKLNQLITFQPFAIKLIDDEDFAPSVNVNSGLAITLTSSNPLVATIINGMIHIVGAGTSVITASQAGDDNYNAAAPKSQTLTVRNGLLSFPYPLPHFLTQ